MEINAFSGGCVSALGFLGGGGNPALWDEELSQAFGIIRRGG